ncbi:MAG: thiamine phosphate synthase [Chloroflexi bacterium]|nr:MAG: thiamine phosphate synthase [Chloroflexota bacterium]
MTALHLPRIHLIGPPEGMDAEVFVATVAAACQGNDVAAHLRMAGRDAAMQLAIARKLRAAASIRTLIINDRVDIALLVHADGVQLGERGLDVVSARQLLGPDALIGRSIHAIDGAREAEAAGADYLIAGHVFSTSSKPGEPERGVGWLAQVVSAVTVPVIAIGGITARNAHAVMEAGAYGIAVMSAVLWAAEPQKTTAEIQRIVESCIGGEQ